MTVKWWLPMVLVAVVSCERLTVPRRISFDFEQQVPAEDLEFKAYVDDQPGVVVRVQCARLSTIRYKCEFPLSEFQPALAGYHCIAVTTLYTGPTRQIAPVVESERSAPVCSTF